MAVDAAVPAILGILSPSTCAIYWANGVRAAVTLFTGIDDSIAASFRLADATAAVSGRLVAVIAAFTGVHDGVPAGFELTETATAISHPNITVIAAFAGLLESVAAKVRVALSSSDAMPI